MKKKNQAYLDYLEAESIYIIRETIAEAKNPVMLYSLGKDSSVLLHLAVKAFYPNKVPFPLLHIDTNWKFSDMYKFRNFIRKKFNLELLVYKNMKGIAENINPFDYNSDIYTDIMKTQALRQALDKFKFDFSFGGARRDEEKSRAKERIFSVRNSKHNWDPKDQRPEVWNLYNLQIKKNQSFRVFPLSNWTEIDIWHYILREKIDIVKLYFSKKRPVVIRNDKIILIDDNRIKLQDSEKVLFKNVRFRTLGCYPLSSGILSHANTLTKIIKEIELSENSERAGRLIDYDQSSSMEIKKLQGYF